MELEQIERVIENAGLYTYLGKIDKIVGTTVESTGPACRLGDVCTIDVVEGGSPVMAEVVGFRENKVLLMPYGETEGIGYGCACLVGSEMCIRDRYRGTPAHSGVQPSHRQDRGRHGKSHR